MTSTALFTPLVIPQSQVNSDRRPCPSDGFNVGVGFVGVLAHFLLGVVP